MAKTRNPTPRRMAIADEGSEPDDPAVAPDPGSFKDPAGMVYRAGDRVLRGLDQHAAAVVADLLCSPFYQRLVADGDVVGSSWPPAADAARRSVLADGWCAVVEHQPVPFLTWPYEWPFSMLKDAALLQLRLLTASVGHGWTLKDATPFNIQYSLATGVPRPIFIDVPSFTPRGGAYWHGHRQFCATFLAPLLLTAHLGVPFASLLKSAPEGVPPEEAIKYFRGLRRFHRGVPAHIWLPARAEQALRKPRARRRPSHSPDRKQSQRMLLALLVSLARLVRRLSYKPRSAWTAYANSHPYDDTDFERKKEFVARHAEALRPALTLDLGANTGVFSHVAARFSRVVVAADADHDAVEALYLAARGERGDSDHRNIIPMVLDVANPSPGLGWAGTERAAFTARAKPDLVLCLALVHHLRVAANVPLPLVIDWLRTFEAPVVMEFVGREDEMFAELIANKQERYEDYSAASFEAHLRGRFHVRDRLALKDGRRELLLLSPA